jgi:hypothetical protein
VRHQLHRALGGLGRRRKSAAALAGQAVTVTYALCGVRQVWLFALLAAVGTLAVHAAPNTEPGGGQAAR